MSEAQEQKLETPKISFLTDLALFLFTIITVAVFLAFILGAIGLKLIAVSIPALVIYFFTARLKYFFYDEIKSSLLLFTLLCLTIVAVYFLVDFKILSFLGTILLCLIFSFIFTKFHFHWKSFLLSEKHVNVISNQETAASNKFKIVAILFHSFLAGLGGVILVALVYFIIGEDISSFLSKTLIAVLFFPLLYLNIFFVLFWVIIVETVLKLRPFDHVYAVNVCAACLLNALILFAFYNDISINYMLAEKILEDRVYFPTFFVSGAVFIYLRRKNYYKLTAQKAD